MSDKNKSTTDSADDPERAPQVGTLLRASRLRVGEDLREVSDNLCIRFLYLEAIEECRYEDLPGDTYAIGFIRSYAEHLGLDGEEVVRRYRMEQASGKRLSDLSFPTPVAESGVPKGAIVLVGVVLAVLVYGGWYATTTDDSILSDLISPVPERLQHLVEDENNKPAEISEVTPEPENTSTNENVETATQNAAGVNSETQEALQANTAEAIAEATAAARGNIADTSASVSDATSQSVSTAVETTTSEATAEQATQSASSATETAASQTTEAVDQASNAVETASETVSSATGTTSSDVTSADTIVEPEPTPETQPAEVATPSAPQEIAETAQASTPSESDTPSAPVDTTTEASASASTETPVTTETAVEEVVSPAPAPVTEQVSAEDLNAQSLQAAASETTTSTQQVATTASAQTATTSDASSTATASSGIVVRAVDNSWVQITDPANGEILFTGLMRPGVTFDVPARSGLLLDTGNAGAIDILVNGNTVPKLGGEGTVRKGVALDSARLIAGTAAN